MKSFWTPNGTRIYLDGDALRGLRKSQGLTLADVGMRAEVSFSAVGHYEREAMCPGPEAIAGLRRVFGEALETSGALKVVAP